MMEQEQNTIVVSTSGLDNLRGRSNKELEVNIFPKNINLFITQISNILDKTPEKVDEFRLTQISVSAEISAKGSLVLLGSGIETEGKGGLTFVFTRL